MGINIGSGLATTFFNFENAATKIRSSAEKMDIGNLTDGIIEMSVSEKLTKANIKQIQAQDEMLGYIIDIKK